MYEVTHVISLLSAVITFVCVSTGIRFGHTEAVIPSGSLLRHSTALWPRVPETDSGGTGHPATNEGLSPLHHFSWFTLFNWSFSIPSHSLSHQKAFTISKVTILCRSPIILCLILPSVCRRGIAPATPPHLVEIAATARILQTCCPVDWRRSRGCRRSPACFFSSMYSTSRAWASSWSRSDRSHPLAGLQHVFY